MKQPILQFDFHDTSVTFTEPIDIIQTTKLSEVNHCLEQVQLAVDNGFYVAGYLSYEVTYVFLNEQIKMENNEYPLLWFGLFHAPAPESNIVPLEKKKHYTVGEWKMRQSKTRYEAQFLKIMEAISRGEIKQVNYTVPFDTTFDGNSYLYYKRLKKAQKASYNAYLQLGDIDIISASPELFFQVKNDEITVKPMKGTIHRGKTAQEDERNKQWLQQSTKNRYENQLITTLMKNELASITEKDTIKATSLYNVEQYPTVYQMTSTVKATLHQHTKIMDIIRTLFPCGSISGVPKKKSLQYIPKIEPYPREIYCGTIGYITPDQEAIFNVPIRTVTINRQNNLATYGAGGAITTHSNLEEEYKEILTKTNVLHTEENNFQLLETLGLIEGHYVVLEEHLERLKASARYFQFTIDIDSIRHKLQIVQRQEPKGSWRVRLTISEHGDIDIHYQPIKPIKNTLVTLAKTPINKDSLFHYHKTTNRNIYNEHLQDDVFDVLLWNEKKEVTEFTIGNIVVEIDNQLYTPPIECGVLPGTYRKSLIDAGKVKEKVIYTNELTLATNIWLVNSVRKWINVHF